MSWRIQTGPPGRRWMDERGCISIRARLRNIGMRSPFFVGGMGTDFGGPRISLISRKLREAPGAHGGGPRRRKSWWSWADHIFVDGRRRRR